VCISEEIGFSLPSEKVRNSNLEIQTNTNTFHASEVIALFMVKTIPPANNKSKQSQSTLIPL
jgi:hypothetical protein